MFCFEVMGQFQAVRKVTLLFLIACSLLHGSTEAQEKLQGAKKVENNRVWASNRSLTFKKRPDKKLASNKSDKAKPANLLKNDSSKGSAVASQKMASLSDQRDPPGKAVQNMRQAKAPTALPSSRRSIPSSQAGYRKPTPKPDGVGDNADQVKPEDAKRDNDLSETERVERDPNEEEFGRDKAEKEGDNEEGDDEEGDKVEDKEEDEGEDEGEDEEEEEGEAEEEEPWRLFPKRCSNRPLVVQGWLGQGFTWNPDRPADGTNGLLGMNDRANDYLLNQVGLSFERPLSDEMGDRRFGLRMDMMFGGDARFVQSQGFDDAWTSGGYFSIAMPQLYADWHMPEANGGEGATLRVGRFWSPIGYEGVSAMDRYFYSATNAFMLAQPSTHTGAMLQMPLGTNWTAQAGVVKGWDVWTDNNNSLGGLATLGWTDDEETTTLTHVLYFGDMDDVLNDNQLTYELIATRQLTERWNYVGWFDFNFAEEIAFDRFGNQDRAQWFSFNQAWIYTINEKWSAGTRFEWFHDDDGVRINDPVTDSLLGAGDLYGLTFGTNYTPTRNWIVRPEIRWDWASRVVPYDDLSSQSQFTAAMDLILLF